MFNEFDKNDKLSKEMILLIRDIIAERERQGISQSGLAQMAGIKQSAISRMESLDALPRLDTLFRILAPLNLKLSVRQIKKIKEQSNMDIIFQELKAINAETEFCRLTVTESTDGALHFITEDESEFFADEKDGIFCLKQKKRGIAKMIFDWIPISAELQIPNSFCGGLVIKNKNFATKVSGLNIGSFELENRNGRVECEDIAADKFKAKSGNGRVILRNITAGATDVFSDNGRIELAGIKAAEIKVKSDNGRVNLYNVSTGKLEIKSDNGKIVAESLTADDIALLSKNGKIVASINGRETEYSIETTVLNGLSIIAGKKNNGSYVYKDKDRKKFIAAHSKNGGINLVFFDTAEAYKQEFSDEIKKADEESGEQED